MKYRIYYGDGGDSEDFVNSSRDVQVILQVDPERGPYFQSGNDYYVNRDGVWVGVDIFGLFDYLMDSGLVLFGRTINSKEYDAIYQKAKGDKSSFLPGERKP